ncbi:general transcription factor IIF subunit 1 [Melopsittacus undulatus]|uniref:general transcription factor IIF subunit 1 n=1 Tax=Melopsittacus undulatus TaxID=13146 RepID=UPI00146BD2CB|nr:general transcription factor IIF subunit 1 [Melopsittacus undulatus]XP_033927814.1 general transcription factor IIF subunit 1 [Melopsittacus undulatus]
MAALGTSSQMVTEYVVRVPKNTPKRYNIMAFNAADRVNFSTWHQARMERDLSNKRIYQEEELPESGAGSEFHRRLRDEARRRKYGIILREFRPEDQPWMLRVNGKAGRKYRGVRKGGVTENASYYIFTQCPDGAFEAFPVQHWFNFTPLAKHRTLTAEEAEEEWERRNKVLNHFSIMQQRRLRDQDEEEEEKEKAAKKKGGELRIHDLEEDLELSSEDSEGSEGEGEKAPRPKKAAPGGKRKKKKKGSEDEAFEDSDDGDFEGQEVDYMSDESSSSMEEEVGKTKVTKEEEGPKGIDEASESSEDSEEEKATEDKEEEEEEKAAPTPQEKKKKKDSSDESQTSEESDIDSETSSALFMAKKKTPPKRERRGSATSSHGNSRPGTPTEPPPSTGSTLRAAASRLEQGRRAPPEPPAAKRLKLEPGPQPPSGKSTPSSGEVQLTEEAVRRYLTRKPMTTKDLLKKFQTKRTGLSSDATVNVLAQILKRLNPERKVIGDKMHFSLKE